MEVLLYSKAVLRVEILRFDEQVVQEDKKLSKCSSIKLLNFIFVHFSEGNVFSSLSKPFFNPIKGKLFLLAVLFPFARPPSN